MKDRDGQYERLTHPPQTCFGGTPTFRRSLAADKIKLGEMLEHESHCPPLKYTEWLLSQLATTAMIVHVFSVCTESLWVYHIM